MTQPLVNWAGNHPYRFDRMHEPTSVEAVQERVRASPRVRALGTGHAFNDLTDTPGDLVSLRGLPRRIDVDAAAQTVTVDGGATYGELCGPLAAAGFALPNLASLPHISVAGACATGTHGSGVALGSLATAVVGLTLVRGDGELVRVGVDAAADGPADGPGGRPSGVPLDGAVVALGSLGIVVSLTLATEPAYRMRQDVFEGLPFRAFDDRFEAIVALGDSVSCFTTWRAPAFHQVWVKRRAAGGEADAERLLDTSALAGARPATRLLHPIPGMPPEACTEQLGVVGPWHERLPHFRLDHRPSAGAELQSEYLVDRRDGPAALRALLPLADRLAPLTHVSELRTVAADRLWLSPASGRASLAIHFTWIADWPAVRALLPAVEAALAPFDPRPHWGKLFGLDRDRIRAAYPDRARFVELATSLDPDGRFRNDFVDAYVFGSAG